VSRDFFGGGFTRIWRSFWSAPVFSGAFGGGGMCLCARNNHSTLKQKRQKRLPHSTTLARGSHTAKIWRSFWSAPVFSGAFGGGGMCLVRTEQPPALKTKRQKGLPHSTTLAREVRYASPYGRSFWSAPVFSGAFRSGGMCLCARNNHPH